MNLKRRLEDLERRPPRPQGKSSEAHKRMVGFLHRIAAARQSGTVAEELKAEMENARDAIRRRRDRGEGGR